MIYALLAFIALGVYQLLRLPATDNERTNLDLDREETVRRWAEEFGRHDLPRRYPWRLPAEYWCYAWTNSLRTARVAALCVSAFALWLSMCYAHWLAGETAAMLTGCIILTSPALVGVLVSASYVAPVSALWVGGLWALQAQQTEVAILCGMALACLRASSWGMAYWLMWPAAPFTMLTTATYMWLAHPEVVRAQGWWLLLTRQKAPMRNWPRDGWLFALKTAARRYESWAAWCTIALVRGTYSPHATRLLLLSAALFALTHFPRTLHRPKWVVGYMPEWAMPVAVALAVMLA